MKFSLFRSAIAFVLTSSICSLASASNLGQFDARSLALGGAGVAGAKSANAAAYNPALIATEANQKNFSMIPFALKVEAIDENDFFETIGDAEKSINGDDGLNERLKGISEGTQTSCGINCYKHDGMGAAAEKTLEVREHIHSLNTSNGLLNANTGIAVQFGKKLPMALIVDGGLSTRLGLKFANSDTKELALYAETMKDGKVDQNEFNELDAAGLLDTSDPSKIKFIRGSDNAEELKSMVEVIGAAYYEIGLSMADNFQYAGGNLTFGITPKVVNVEAVKYHQSVESEDFEADDILDDDNIVSKTDFNIDLGVIYKPFQSQPFQTGLTVKNLFTRTYKLKKSAQEIALEIAANGTGTAADDARADLDKFRFRQDVKIEPQITAGVAYQLPLFNVLADLDLNAAEVLGHTSQHFSLGVELDLKLLQLQAGYRTSIGGDEEEDAVSVGLSLGFLDVAGVFAGDNYGAVVQVSFSF